MRYEVINFVVHLKIKFQEGLSRLILLDYCLMEVAGIGLEVLEPDSTLFKALTQKLGNFTQCKPYSFSFSESEIKMRAREYENFMRNYHDA